MKNHHDDDDDDAEEIGDGLDLFGTPMALKTWYSYI